MRNYSDTPGLFAVSRIDDASGKEVLVVFNTSIKPLIAQVELDPAATTLTALAGICPASVRAPGSAAITLGALDFAICAVK